MAWNEPGDARRLWRDAPSDDETLTLYLESANAACLAYAPALGEDDDIPASYRLAEAMQARNIYNGALASPSGDFDGSGYGLSAFPLDWQVKQLLRPRTGLGALV